MKNFFSWIAGLFGKKKKLSAPTPSAALSAAEIEEMRETARGYIGSRSEWPKVNQLFDLALKGLCS